MSDIQELEEISNVEGIERPRRSIRKKKVVLSAESDTGWIKKGFYPLIDLDWNPTEFVGVTAATVKVRDTDKDGNYYPDSAGKTLEDGSGNPITIDMTNKNRLKLDDAGLYSEIMVDFGVAVTGTLLVKET